jgi:hypothetical protein
MEQTHLRPDKAYALLMMPVRRNRADDTLAVAMSYRASAWSGAPRDIVAVDPASKRQHLRTAQDCNEFRIAISNVTFKTYDGSKFVIKYINACNMYVNPKHQSIRAKERAYFNLIGVNTLVGRMHCNGVSGRYVRSPTCVHVWRNVNGSVPLSGLLLGVYSIKNGWPPYHIDSWRLSEVFYRNMDVSTASFFQCNCCI